MSASDIQPWLQPIATVLAASAAIVGLGISHWLTSKRDLIAEKRKIQINFILETYRKLEQGACRGANQDQYAEEFHSAISDIQLLGSPEQVRVAQRIAAALAIVRQHNEVPVYSVVMGFGMKFAPSIPPMAVQNHSRLSSTTSPIKLSARL
jgi:hypothetical protein